MTIEVGETVTIGGMPVCLVSVSASGAVVCLGQDGDRATFRRRYKRPADATPADEEAVLEIAGIWSRRVQRLTVLNQARFSAINARLRDGYTFAEMTAAVEEYSRSEWNRSHSIWLDPARFFTPEHLEKWARKADERGHAERIAASASPARDPRVNSAAADMAARMDAERRAVRDREDALLGRFNGLAEGEQAALLSQAVAELDQLRPGSAARLKPSLAFHPVRQQLLVILDRDATEAGKAGNSFPASRQIPAPGSITAPPHGDEQRSGLHQPQSLDLS